MLRIAIVGLDGLSWRYLEKLLNIGVMPYTKSLIASGFKANLYAFPPMTPPSWTSIMTGVNIGKHGIYDFIHGAKGQMVLSAHLLEHPRIHEMLSIMGIRSIVINPIPTHPFYPMKNTIQISNSFFTPKILYYPPHAKKYTKHLTLFEPSASLEDALDKGIMYVREYIVLIEDLISNEDFNLIWINMPYPDHLLHRAKDTKFLTSKFTSEETKLFKEVDDIIKILDKNSEYLVIVSDHGFSAYKYTLELNTLLFKKGFISVRKPEEQADHNGTERDKEIKVKSIDTENLITKIALLKPIKPIAKMAKFLYEKITGHRLMLTPYVVDPEKSIAYVPSHTSFAIRVKDLKYINEVMKVVRKTKGIKAVYRRDELFTGPYTYRLPELYFEPNFDEGYYVGSTKIWVHTIVSTKSEKFLEHHPMGVLVISPCPFRSVAVDTIPNYLVTNLLMSLMDVPLSSYADGVDIVTKFLGKKPRLTTLYVKRWRLIKRIYSIRSR